MIWRALALGIMISTPAAAQQQTCADRSIITRSLQENYGEEFAGGGLRNSTSIYEVWENEETGTWTILMTKPDGSSCVMAAGTDWRHALPNTTPAGDPT